MAMTRRKKVFVALLVALLGFDILLILVVQYWPVWAARYGSPVMRQIILSQWVDQDPKLGPLQKRVVIALLYQRTDDPEARGEALGVINAHLKEDEDEFVRHLAYVAFTAGNPSDCSMALYGLAKASPKHKELAVSAFRYHLTDLRSPSKADQFKMVPAVVGLARFSVHDALPTIEALTNHSNTFLAFTAEKAAARLKAAKN